jgi:DNA-nicking Smr family endonuclease
MTRRLTREDRELWDRLRVTVKPLRAEAAPEESSTVLQAEGKDQVKHEAGPDSPAPSRQRSPGPPALARLEERSVRRLRRGLTEVEQRIDLHGMRQERAFARLISFLREAQSRGSRMVLVITGKGREGTEADGGRGVLKQVVPMWLARPEFRDLIVGFSDAGRRHGGGGALYVQIRRKGRRGG